MKRLAKIILIAFVLVGLTVPQIGCSSESDEAEVTESQVVTVQRGDLAVEITAAGNLALSRTEDLAFDLFYQEGTVAEVLVEEGDIVTEEQVLARLDTEEWEDNLEELQDKLTTAERALTARERALVSAERKIVELERAVTDKADAVTKAERLVTTKEFAVRQAQLDVETAEDNLSQIDEVQEAQDVIDDAQYALDFAKSVLSGEFGGGLHLYDYSYWSQLKALAQAELAEAQQDLREILAGSSITLSNDVLLEVQKKQILVEQKQMALVDAQIAVDDAVKAVADAGYALEDAQLDVEDARHDLEDARLDVEDARKALLDVQEKLAEANSKSPLIVALFDGFITRVNVAGGDEVLSGTVAVQLADPDKFEAEILVSEMDISQVKEGGEARVQVDAMSGLTLPAEVTNISPTATIQSGVVNYKVKVEVQSLESVMHEQQAARQETMQNISSGELPDKLKQAIEEGRLTQEQAEEMIKQGQAKQQPPQGQTPTVIPEEDFQLREGLTVTVTIVVAEKNDILLVPNSAITRQGVQDYVTVESADGTREERAIQTGISDWQYTEVISGLSEGEKVAVTMVPSPDSTSSTPRGRVPIFGPPPHG